jgi:hypothetical protein
MPVALLTAKVESNGLTSGAGRSRGGRYPGIDSAQGGDRRIVGEFRDSRMSDRERFENRPRRLHRAQAFGEIVEDSEQASLS